MPAERSVSTSSSRISALVTSSAVGSRIEDHDVRRRIRGADQRLDAIADRRGVGIEEQWATLSLAAGADIKVVSHELGHSSTQITLDVYTSVIPQVSRAAADAVAALLASSRAAQASTASGDPAEPSLHTSCNLTTKRTRGRRAAAAKPQVRPGGAGGARTHDPRIMSPLL
jgi:hypothetical protein